MQEKDFNIIKRLWIYQKERFPIFAYGLMVFTFCFSAMSYSKFLRGSFDFSFTTFIIGALTSFGYFFLLRIFDEFKDSIADAKYRPYRAVPRGLVSFFELRILAFLIIAIQFILNLVFIPRMLVIWVFVISFMLIMRREFFLGAWLLKHPVFYLITHMLVMPVIDFYTTGLDWRVLGAKVPCGLLIFLIVTFLNGVVIEIGRKIRSKSAEEFGVETYSFLWGEKKAAIVWLCVLFLTFVFSNIACFLAGFSKLMILYLLFFYIFCSFFALRFIKTRKQKDASILETISGIWTIGMYLSLGGIPMIIHFLGGILN